MLVGVVAGDRRDHHKGEALEKHTKSFSLVTSCPLVTVDCDW